MFINTLEGGSCIGFPDVCMTPGPGGSTPPIPYANTAEHCLAESGSFSSKVFVNGMNALHLNTTIAQSDGNEAGSGGGAATLNNLAGLYQAQGRYEKTEPLYQRCLSILRTTFPNGHPNIDAGQANYDDLKRKMAGQ